MIRKLGLVALALTAQTTAAHAFFYNPQTVKSLPQPEPRTFRTNTPTGTWGAGYNTLANVSYNRYSATSETLRAQGTFTVWGEMFSKRHDLTSIRGYAYSQIGAGRGFTLSVYTYIPGYSEVFNDGQMVEIFNPPTWTGTISGDNATKSFSKTLASAFYGYSIGPLEVGVRVKAEAELGFAVSGYVSPTALDVTFRPFVGIDAVGSAGAEAKIYTLSVAGAKAYASLNLLTASLPIRGAISRISAVNPCANIASTLSVNFTLDSFRGKIWVDAWLAWEHWKKTLVEWDAQTTWWNKSLYNATSTECI